MINCLWLNRRDYIGFDGILAYKDAFRLKKKWRRIETMCTLTYASRNARIVYGGTRYISHSRWYDDVTQRCAHRAHPVLSLITIYRLRSIANGVFWNFTKFLAFSFARASCAYLLDSLTAELRRYIASLEENADQFSEGKSLRQTRDCLPKLFSSSSWKIVFKSDTDGAYTRDWIRSDRRNFVWIFYVRLVFGK